MAGSPSVDAAHSVVELLGQRARWLGAAAADVLRGDRGVGQLEDRMAPAGVRGEEEVDEEERRKAEADVRTVREFQFWVSGNGILGRGNREEERGCGHICAVCVSGCFSCAVNRKKLSKSGPQESSHQNFKP